MKERLMYGSIVLSWIRRTIIGILVGYGFVEIWGSSFLMNVGYFLMVAEQTFYITLICIPFSTLHLNPPSTNERHSLRQTMTLGMPHWPPDICRFSSADLCPVPKTLGLDGGTTDECKHLTCDQRNQIHSISLPSLT